VAALKRESVAAMIENLREAGKAAIRPQDADPRQCSA
jgi:hypothetical protein